MPLMSTTRAQLPMRFAASLAGGVLVIVPAALPAGEAAGPGPAPGPAPAARRLTLEEARQLALGNYKALALARLNVAEKEYATTAARKDYFPKLLGNVTYFHFND